MKKVLFCSIPRNAIFFLALFFFFASIAAAENSEPAAPPEENPGSAVTKDSPAPSIEEQAVAPPMTTDFLAGAPVDAGIMEDEESDPPQARQNLVLEKPEEKSESSSEDRVNDSYVEFLNFKAAVKSEAPQEPGEDAVYKSTGLVDPLDSGNTAGLAQSSL